MVLRQPFSAYGAAAAALVGCTTFNAALRWRLAASENHTGAALRLAGAGLAVNLMAATASLTVASALGRTSELDQVVALVIALWSAALLRTLAVRRLTGAERAHHLNDRRDLSAVREHDQDAMLHETSP